MKFVVVFSLLTIFTTVRSQNYCLPKYCPNGLHHIACHNSNTFASRCKQAKMVNMAPHKALILQLHNTKRNLIAGGGLKGYKAAKRMATMQWDDELARLAGMNVKQCIMKHDECRNTDKYHKAGQNLGTFGSSGNSNSDAFLITNRVNSWWAENKNCKMAYINSYPANYNGPAIGHFTVMTAEKNIRVGCAAARYFDGKHQFLLACDYATTNINGKPLYVSGATAFGCKTGKNPKYKNLCSTAEVYSDL